MHGFLDRYRDWKQTRALRRVVAESPLFDAEWYRLFYPEVAATGADPLDHFLAYGAERRLHPSLHFDTIGYLDRNPDVRESGVNPLVHYLHCGRAEGRPITRPVDRPDFFDHLASARWTSDLRSDRAWAGVAARQPLVSVILPTKDRAAVLPDAIKSVVAQTWRHWELVVVDDASADDTCGIVRRACDDPRIRLLPSAGRGVCDARNTGLAAARGAFIAYLDSDNTWTREYLELMLAELARSGADSAYAVLEIVQAAAALRPPAIRYIQRRFSREALLAWNFVDINVFMHRRELYDELGGFDSTLRRVEDWDLVLRYSAQHRVSFANFVGAVYDDGPSDSRLSNRESVRYVNVVRNKHLIDWAAVRRELPGRDAGLTSVVVVADGPAERTARCIESLASHDAGAPFEVVLVQPAAGGGDAGQLQPRVAARPAIRLVQVPECAGFSLAANIGCAQARGSRIVFLSDATEVFPGWLRGILQTLATPLDDGPRVGLLQPAGADRCLGIMFPQRSPPGRRIHLLRPDAALPGGSGPDYVEIQPGCIVVQAEDFVRAGGFDPLAINGPEDVDCFHEESRTGQSRPEGAASDG